MNLGLFIPNCPQTHAITNTFGTFCGYNDRGTQKFLKFLPAKVSYFLIFFFQLLQVQLYFGKIFPSTVEFSPWA